MRDFAKLWSASENLYCVLSDSGFQNIILLFLFFPTTFLIYYSNNY